MRDETVVIHGGYAGENTRAVAVPIYQTVAHEFESAAQAGAIFDMQEPGFHYNRLNNPTAAVLEERIALLEGAAAAMVTASGMAAVNLAVLNVATAGSNIVCAPQLYGSTYTLFQSLLPHMGIQCKFAADDSADAIAAEIDDDTRLVFCESIGNPAGNVVDVEAVATAAHAHGVPLVVDNTVATPLLLKPIRHGADVIVHSLTKFIGGHGTTLGGAVVDSGTFDWAARPDRFPMFAGPEPAYHNVVYTDDFPTSPFLTRCRTIGMRYGGATLAPMNSFLLLQGLETLSVRLERHEANTRVLAERLAADPRVGWVAFVGFADHPHHAVAQRYLGDRVPSLFTFGPAAGYDASIAFFDRVRVFKRLVNLGDAKSLVAHPASTTHRQLSSEDLVRVGIRPEAIRLSIGIEHVEDLWEDIDQALG
jgi:O-acetylhomoserine (thiol)-lyase